MLGLRRLIAAFVTAALVASATGVVSADLQQLGDAWADLTTFGAWGKSRDTYAAEIELIQLRHKEEIIRLQNASTALQASATITQQLLRIVDAQRDGQRYLLIATLSEALLAQLKNEISERYETKQDLTNFEEWFDSFVQNTDDTLDGMVSLLNVTLKGQDAEQVMTALQLRREGQASSTATARDMLKRAVARTKWDGVRDSMALVLQIQDQARQGVLEKESQIRSLFAEIKAADDQRRALCDPPQVSLECKDGLCRYRVPNGPCGDVVFLNVFPASFVTPIFDNVARFKPHIELFLDLTRLNEMRAPTRDAFSTSEEVFGRPTLDQFLPKDTPANLSGCIDSGKTRLRFVEALDYTKEVRHSAIPSDIQALLGRIDAASPELLFSVDFVLGDIASLKDCSVMSPQLRQRLVAYTTALSRLEDIGTYLTFSRYNLLREANFFDPVMKMAQ